MADSTGFWSYVHKDDEAEKGRIAQLAHDLVEQYEMITGETINLFLDRDSIEWGDNWRARIDDGLLNAAFFVAILTPRYFTSKECRRELQTFAREARRLGIADLILSILYVDIPALDADPPQDELMALIKPFQWSDWRELRFADPNSSEYRQAVAEMANRLANASRDAIAAELPSTVDAASPSSESEDGIAEEPGLIDILAAGQTEMQAVGITSAAMSDEMNTFNSFVVKATEDIKRSDQEGRGPVGRLAIAKELAQNLTQPADRFLELANEYTSKMYDADRGTMTLISMAEDEIERNPDSKDTVCEFFKITTATAQTAQLLATTLGQFSEGITQNEKISRDLRPPLQTMKHGVAIVMEASSLAEGWLKAIEESQVDCTDRMNG
jgi:TIR domain